MTEDEKLERRRKLARARRKRFDQRNPGASAKHARRNNEARKIIIAAHHEEYLGLAAAEREAGAGSGTSYAKAFTELRRRYPDEWRETLAAQS